jgi:hypothetical protein
VYFSIFLGGKSSTRPIARLFLVNVSKFLQLFFILNCYGVFILHFFQDYEIVSLKPLEVKSHLIDLTLTTFHLLDCARNPTFLKLCDKILVIATP